MAANSKKTATRRRGPGRPFAPGESGNPGGRPKKDRQLTAALETIVDKTELAEKLWGLAKGGDLSAIKYIYDRLEGSPTQRHEVSHDDVLEKVRQMARERGLSDDAAEQAVKTAEEMLRSSRSRD